MSTETSPLNRPRSKKITGGRSGCMVYFPPNELDEIEKTSEKSGVSKSSLILQRYNLGKDLINKNIHKEK